MDKLVNCCHSSSTLHVIGSWFSCRRLCTDHECGADPPPPPNIPPYVYGKYSKRGSFERLIQHKTKPSAILVSRHHTPSAVFTSIGGV